VSVPKDVDSRFGVGLYVTIAVAVAAAATVSVAVSIAIVFCTTLFVLAVVLLLTAYLDLL
jgi:hypothetical protein